jgi:hypothetical protein
MKELCMSTKAIRIFMAAAAIGLAATFAASAAPVGHAAPITTDLAAYFTGFGVDPQYLNVPVDKVPADQLAKIDKALSATDYTFKLVNYNTKLSSLVYLALSAATDKQNDPVYIQIGNAVWQMEKGGNPAGSPPAGSRLVVVNPDWIPID